MASLDWDEYKEYKQYCVQEDKLRMVIGFIKSYYNVNSPSDMYEILHQDDIGNMMMKKRAINDAEGLEYFIFNI